MDVPATINPLAEAGRLEELWSPQLVESAPAKVGA
jgi:hypothetical protein